MSESRNANGHDPVTDPELKEFWRASSAYSDARRVAEEAQAKKTQADAELREAREAEHAAQAERNASPNPLNGAFEEPVPEDPLFKLFVDGQPHGEKCRRFLEAVGLFDWAENPAESISAFFQRLKTAGLAPKSRLQRRAGGQMATALDELSRLLKVKAHVDLSEADVYKEWSPVIKEAAQSVFGPEWMDVETPAQEGMPPPRPKWLLPDGARSITEAAEELGRAMARGERIFVRKTGLIQLNPSESMQEPPTLQPVTPSGLVSLIDPYVVPHAYRGSQPQQLEAVLLPEVIAKHLLNSKAFVRAFPPLNRLVNCPLLVERGAGTEILQPGYDKISGTFVSGTGKVEEVALEVAIPELMGLLDDFIFASQADKSRAVAMLITPAMVFGGILTERFPMDVGEAEESQSGKGYRNQVQAAIYHETISSFAQKSPGGVGSLDESFDFALVAGRPFIQLDNLRGKLNSQKMESCMTASTYLARTPYGGCSWVQPNKFFFLMTSNGAELTDDMANRSCIVRIRKKAGAYRTYAEGDLLAHVRANQPHYLGCVFAVLQEWISRAKPRTKEERHDFREWCGSLDWIVQNLFHLPPLMDDHESAQERASNPSLSFVRQMAIAIEKSGRLGEELIASQLWHLASDLGVQIPGLSENAFGSPENGYRTIERIMRQAFQTSDIICIEGFQVERGERELSEDVHHAFKCYCFTRR